MLAPLRENERCPASDTDRDAHPQCVACRGAAGARPAIERDVDAVVEREVIRSRLPRQLQDASGRDTLRCEQPIDRGNPLGQCTGDQQQACLGNCRENLRPQARRRVEETLAALLRQAKVI